MPLLDLQRLTHGLSRTWTGFLRDWDRSLRSGNYPETTRYNYLLAAAQLGRYLAEYSPDPDPDDAAGDLEGSKPGSMTGASSTKDSNCGPHAPPGVVGPAGRP